MMRFNPWRWTLAWLFMGLMPLISLAGNDDATSGRRLVSLAPNLTELVYALGLERHLVGRSSACDYPPETSALAVVGGFGRPNDEALWQVRPDIVVATDLEKPGLRRQLEERGVTVLILPCESWDGLKEAATALGVALHEEPRANAWIETLNERLDALHRRTESRWAHGQRPSVYVEVWGNPVTTAGGQSFLHEVIEIAGGRNITGSLRGRYQPVSSEWIIRENPSVIVLAYMFADMQAAERVRKRVGWSSIDAIRRDRIIDDIPPDLLLRPGPRLIEGAEWLAEQLFAVTRD